MRTDTQNLSHDKTKCRRDVILRQLLLLVREIEEYDKQPSSPHYRGAIDHKTQNYHQGEQQPPHHDQQALKRDQQALKHDQQALQQHQQDAQQYQQDVQQYQQDMQHKEQDVKLDDPSCRCVGDDLLKDEYYQPQTVDGQPGRPVLTRRGGQGRIQWCPPCYEIVPPMDYTFICYRPPHKRHQQDERPTRGPPADLETQNQRPEGNANFHPENRQRINENEQRNQQQERFDNYQQERLKDHHAEEKGRSRENLKASQGTYTCYYDPLEESSRRVECTQLNQKERQGQPYTGNPDSYQEHLWEGGDGLHPGHRREEQHPGDKYQHQPGYTYDEPKHHQQQPSCRQDQTKHQQQPGYTYDEPKHHQQQPGYDEPKQLQANQPGYQQQMQLHEHQHTYRCKEPMQPQENQPGGYRQEMYHPESYPKTAVMLKPKEDDHRRFAESKYYPVLIPKDVVWPKHKQDHIQHKPSRPDESKYATVLIPKDSMGPTEGDQSWGKVHHGRPERCHSDNKRHSGNVRQNSVPKALPNVERRNGLAPEMKEEQKNGSKGQSIFCYEDRIRKDYQDAMNWDVYGGQKCPHVHPPPSYFTYSCPEDKNHFHWSPPETTICRYPNTCMASCFEHPVLNNWVYRQPNNRFYLQRRDYTPF